MHGKVVAETSRFLKKTKEVKQPAEKTDHRVEHLLQAEENEVQYTSNRQWRKVPESQGASSSRRHHRIFSGFFTTKDKKEKKDMEMDLHWKCLCGVTVVEFVCQKDCPSYMRKFLVADKRGEDPKQTEFKKITYS